MNVEIETEADKFPGKKNHTWDFRCSAPDDVHKLLLLY